MTTAYSRAIRATSLIGSIGLALSIVAQSPLFTSAFLVGLLFLAYAATEHVQA